MSMGYGGFARKVLEDEKTVIYEYGGFNLNESEFRNEAHIYDGMITIFKCCFPEPEIHEKLKKMPGGHKKLLVKRIPVRADIWNLMEEGLISIENCSNAWKLEGEESKVDMIALRLISSTFREYQENGKIPETAGVYY